MTKKRVPHIVSGSLQRAIAEDRERTRTNSQVSYSDLNDGRPSVGRLPFLVITSELREQHGWGPHRAVAAPAPVEDGKAEGDAR